MKVLFVGDVHNHMYIFEDVKRLDAKYNFDRIIFLGDYVDDWGTDNHQSLETLETVFNLKHSNPEKYTFCLGNHELSYLGFPCSGHQSELEDIMKLKLEENIDCFDFYTTIHCDKNEYVCTHAGITNGYVETTLGGDMWKQFLFDINQNKLNNLKILTKCSYLRGGSDEFSSFLWADKREHAYFKYQDKKAPYQIVGHTPVTNIQIVDNIIFCDTHSTYRDGTPYGDKSYLIWNDRGFIIET